jgi:hypothetical protein
MSILKKSVILSIALVFCCVSLSLAADQTQKRDRKKAGTCKTVWIDGDAQKILAADQTRTRDRIRTPKQRKGGSCRIIQGSGSEAIELAAGKTRTRTRSQQRLRDGSCKLVAVDSQLIS